MSVLSVTIWGKRRRRHSSALIGMQMSPFPTLAMKFTFSVVANCAAQMRSPSFSRSGSSVTRMTFPARRSPKACSMVSNWKSFMMLLFL